MGISKTANLILSTLVITAFPSLIFAQCAVQSASREIARGVVFLDSNANGSRERSERGIANVSVSNGCDVVSTNDAGEYTISVAATEIIFISQPENFTVPVDQNFVPQFFYKHYPEGTPGIVAGTSVEWLWPVIDATGPLPASIDFPLLASSGQTDQFSAYAFADPQARYELGEDMVREDLVNSLIGNPYAADFGITVGDVVFDTLSLYDRHKEMMALMDVPQWYLPGNHDLNYESPDSLFANETYKKHFGPTYYSFDRGNVHIVTLNNVEYAGDGNEFSNGRYRGRIPDSQLQWLRNDLALVDKDKLILLASHIPFVAEATDETGARETGPGTENFSQLLEILQPFENIYAIAGHDTSHSWKVEINHSHGWSGQPWIAHTLAEVRGNGWTTGPADMRGVRDAMMQDGNPNGFYVLQFDDTDLVPQFIPFPNGADAGKAMRIVIDPPLEHSNENRINYGSLATNSKIVVNLFDGGVRDKVSISIDSSDRAPMNYRVRTDPFLERAYADLLDTDSEIGRPGRSSHIWEIALPNELTTGIHRVEVFSEDEFGQQNQGLFSFEISDE